MIFTYIELLNNENFQFTHLYSFAFLLWEGVVAWKKIF